MEILSICAASVLAGAIAALSGFGIGSVLTPLFAWSLGTKAAVAVVALPHFGATLFRCWLLRAHIDRRVLLTFGLASAVGGLMGAYLHTISGSRLLTLVFGALLILSGLGQLFGFWDRVTYGPKMGPVAGIFSGLLGGLVGNQGGIRTAAMFGFHVPKEAFIATGTAAALAVDFVRTPIYILAESAVIQNKIPHIAVAMAGTLIGTWVGVRFLRQIPDALFRRCVTVLLLVLGVAMLLKGMRTL